MPKVLIREYDKSTTGIPASDNFAVVVPGYFGTPATNEETGEDYDPKEMLWNSSDVYEVTSQSDFIKYIGRLPSGQAPAKAPTLNVINTAPEANDYTKYIKPLTQAEFNNYLNPENTTYTYIVEVVSTNAADAQDGYLVKTISYKEKKRVVKQIHDEETGEMVNVLDDAGNPVYIYIDNTDADAEVKTVVLRMTPITDFNDVDFTDKETEVNICQIEKGAEGKDELNESHIGNQIAYELLGLGYTVLYKKLDESVPAQRIQMLNEADFWEPLKDKSIFNFRYVMTGGYYSATAMSQISKLAEFRNDTILEDAETFGKLSGRGDCIALCDIDENIPDYEITANLTLQQLITNIGEAAKRIQSNAYSAIFAPRVTYVMDDTAVAAFGNNKTFPASFHYLACAARAFEKYNEWYAVAGYTRGISNYSIANTSVKLGEIAINTLAPRVANTYTNKSVNLILHERGNYYLWGNRTGYTLDSNGIVFHHFLNIRQLCCTIKKQLYTACRQFTFDPNSDLLWINFVNAIKPTLEAMKADQGIKGYTITRTANDKKALLTARIRIVPIEAVEDFDISIYLEDSLTGIVVNASEA